MSETEKAAAVAWQAFVDLRGDIEKGFVGVNKRLDTTNGSITDLNRFRFLSIGALSVLTFLVSVFGATALVLAFG